MKKPYLAWWYPGFSNPDPNGAIESVHLCTVDNEINIFFRNKNDLDAARSAYPTDRRLMPYADKNHMMVLKGGREKITMDTIAEEIGQFEVCGDSFDAGWLREQIAAQKLQAGFSASTPSSEADYDIRNCTSPLLQSVIASQFGGTIFLRKDARPKRYFPIVYDGPVGEEHTQLLAETKEKIMGLQTTGVQFTADENDPLQIHFRWQTPLVHRGRDRAEYLSVQKLFSVISDAVDVSQDIQGMKDQTFFIR